MLPVATLLELRRRRRRNDLVASVALVLLPLMTTQHVLALGDVDLGRFFKGTVHRQ